MPPTRTNHSMTARSVKKRLRQAACGLLALLFSGQGWSSQTLTAEDIPSLRRDYQLYQAWSLGRNYYFGTTVKKDRTMALAWQLIYVSLLPERYPDKNTLLSLYQQGLSSSQHAEAKNMAASLKEKYHLTDALSEEQLAVAYRVRDEVNAWDKVDLDLPPQAVSAHFNHWVQWLADRGNRALALSLDEQASQLNREKKFPILYGQVVIRGPEPMGMVQSNVSLGPEGYFVTQAADHLLTFALPGYQSVVIPVDNRSIQRVGPVVMVKRSHSQGTGVVGRVLPWRGLQYGNIVLTLDETNTIKQSDPWYHPVIPLTVTPAGEFYATGLVPGKYHLYITTAGVSTAIQFTAKEGEIRGLSLIDLRTRAGQSTAGKA